MRSTTTVAGRSLADATLLTADPSGWTDLGFDALVVCRGADDSLTGLLEIAAAHDIATLTLDDSLVPRGVAVGVAVQQARLQIVVNLAASRAQGLQLSTDLLQLVQLTP